MNKSKYPVVDSWMDGLSIRAQGIMIGQNIDSKELLLSSYLNGKLNPKTSKVFNYGWKTRKEIALWLGLPEPKK